MVLYMTGGRWLPAGVARTSERRPVVGQLIAFDYAAWRVTHVADADPDDDDRAYLEGMTPRYQTLLVPFRVSLRREHGPKRDNENSNQDIAVRCTPRFRGFDTYETDRVPLCSCCNNPWPCRLLIAEDQASKAAQRMEEELKLLPGCCPTCQEPITPRQKTITFPGEYVRNPLAPADPVFHLRRKCVHGAEAYEEQWVKADPSRPRSLLTLRCEGSLITCGDGYSECHGAEDCPSVYASHRSASSCYTQSHGCGRQCGSLSHGCSPLWAAKHGDWPAVPS